MYIKFKSKAQTLESLSKTIQSAKILPLIFFSVKDWKNDHKKCKQRVVNKLGSGPFIVRSSSQNEDTISSSNAGA